MALLAPDMEDCCKKQRCTTGVNIGELYSTCDPCPSGQAFNSTLCDCQTQVGIWEIGIETYGKLGLRASLTLLVEIPEPFFDESGQSIQKVVGRFRQSVSAGIVWSSFEPDGPAGIAACPDAGLAGSVEPFVKPGMRATLNTDLVCDSPDDDYFASPGSAGHLVVANIVDGCFAK